MSFQDELQFRNWVEIDLDNFTRNLNEVRRIIGPQAKILQVVKADAYGHGAIEISHVAVRNGASCLGVANADEGIQLRVGGITAPIIILSPSTISEIPEIIKYDLIPSVSDLHFATELQDRSHKAGKRTSVHVEADTGMGRGGTMNHHILTLLQAIRDFPDLLTEGLFTHLAQSEAMSPGNDRQWQLFRELLDDLQKRGISIPLRHMANSGAIMNYPLFHLDMVRPGLMTYGVYPSPETLTKAQLAPVMSFKTRVLLIKDFPSGCGIGYGSTFVTTRPTKIATIPVGYGDGYGFLLSNRGEALIGGRRVPVAGRISMDMCTLDVTDLPSLEIGEEVVLMGRQGTEEITPDDIAAQTQTISYEVLCALGKRAPRLFMQRGQHDALEPRLRRIFIPDEEKSLSRLDNVIRRCLHARVNDAEFGDAIYYTILETLFGKEDRQLELRSNFRYDISLEEFSASATEKDEPAQPDYYHVTTRVQYDKILKSNVFMIGCAESDEQLAALLEDQDCEYRWLLSGGRGDLRAARDFSIRKVRVNDEEVPLIREAETKRGRELWYGRESLNDWRGKEVKVDIEVATKISRTRRDFSVYLIYPIRGLDITFNHQGRDVKNVREVPFFAGKHPYPTIVRDGGKISLHVADDEWVFPTSGVTFFWD